MDKLLKVTAVLRHMVEFLKNGVELFVERSQHVGLLMLILGDALLIGNDMSLHLSSL